MEPKKRAINTRYPQAILKEVFCFITQCVGILSACKSKHFQRNMGGGKRFYSPANLRKAMATAQRTSPHSQPEAALPQVSAHFFGWFSRLYRKKVVTLPSERGKMPEWSIGPHSKCGERATVPRVRIPVFPPIQRNCHGHMQTVESSYCPANMAD